MIEHILKADFEAQEKILANAIMAVVRELRLVDVAALIDLIHRDRMAELADVFASAAELYFKPHTLDFAMLAKADIGWLTPPRITLRLELASAGVTILFGLTMQADTASVSIDAVLSDDAAEIMTAAELSHAIAGARWEKTGSGKLGPPQ